MSLQQIMLGGAMYPVLDPANKGSNVTLLTNYRATTSNVGMVRATKAVPAGAKKFWEVKWGSAASFNYIGVVAAASNVELIAGSDADSYSMRNDGFTVTNNALSTQFATTFNVNDIMGLVLDRALATLAFYQNGVLLGTLNGISANAIYPAMSSSVIGDFTINFGPTMAYSIPAGATLLTM